MTITVRMQHSGPAQEVEIEKGQTIADALEKIGYPKMGHEYWRATIRGWPIALHAVVPEKETVTVIHIAAGA